jgi:cell division protein FtsW
MPKQINILNFLKGDKVLWIVILLLVLFSIPAVFSATGSLAYQYQDGDTSYYFLRHTFFVISGLIVIFISHKISYKLYFNIATAFLIFTIFLLILTLLIGQSVNDATRWLKIPIIGIEFQTSDLAKLALIMYVAKILSVNQENKENLKKAFFIILIATGAVCIFILPENLSTTLLLGGTVLIMMFIGRIEHKYLLILIGLAAVIFTIFILVVMSSGVDSRLGTWKARIENFFNGDEQDNFQSTQSKIAVAKGGWIGTGSGNSTQRNILPHPYSDFIFAVIVEEYGFAGGIVIVGLYLLILFRAILIVKRTNRTFPAFLAVGLSMVIVFQSIINMGVAVGLIPVTGQPLPLVSMGGTSTLITAYSLGILLNISRKEETKTVEEKKEEEKFEVKDYPFIMG